MAKLPKEKDKPPEYWAVVEAIRACPKNIVGSAIAHVYADVLEEFARERFGKLQQPGPISVQSFTGKYPRDVNPYLNFVRDDHSELRKKDGKKTYISQPYGLSLRDLEDLVAQCHRFGMDVQIDARSWYFPHWTLCVIFTNKVDP
jgi:hypothetical protein